MTRGLVLGKEEYTAKGRRRLVFEMTDISAKIGIDKPSSDFWLVSCNHFRTKALEKGMNLFLLARWYWLNKRVS